MTKAHEMSGYTLPGRQLAQLVEDARRHTLRLVADLTDDQLAVPQSELVNPFLWELGHVAFFYDACVLEYLDSTRLHLEGAEHLYDSFRVDHDDRWGLPLPSRDETMNYMDRVRERVRERIEGRDPTAKETYCYQLAVLHEDMHGEAFTWMRQTLEYPAPEIAGSEGTGSETAWSEGTEQESGPLPGDVEIPGGTFQLGATPDLPFVFDNEKWAHPAEVAPFKIARAPVTNAEFCAFVDDGGYGRRDLWTHEGWVWRARNGIGHPVYWCRGSGGWRRRDFDRSVPIEEHAPVVHVSWHEAEAYCNWADRRLPTEAEWEIAASAEPATDGNGISPRKRRWPWGDDVPSPELANLDGRRGGCVDVAAFAAGDSAFGCRQMAGNVWEWTSSAFYPFPGYVVDLPYKEYSAPWFGYRKVLKGGAWATRSRLAYNVYRNFFLPDRRDVFAGFRTCAK